MDELERIKSEFRNKKKKPIVKTKNNKYFFRFLTRLSISVILTLVTLIILKSNQNLKQPFYKELYENNFSFTQVNNLYQKYFGSPIPFKDYLDTSQPVFNEKLTYKEANKYMDGVVLSVDEKYLIPNQLSGLVVFIGDKEGYGNTVIIQQANGIDLWYGNVDLVNVKLYDYVEQGQLLGTTLDNKLYLVYKKDGQILDYNDFI